MENQKVKRKFKASKTKAIALLIVIVILIVLVVLIFTKKNNPLIGKWSNEKDTTYQFDKDYTGKLILSIGEYKYKYEINDDKLFVDFENDTSTDTEFTFKIEDEKLILTSNYGTFTFKKID